MIEYFKIVYSSEVEKFFDNLDQKARNKIIYNIDKTKFNLNPKNFKKLINEIWEFKTKHETIQYRILAFWDKRDKKNTLVIATHGIIKKTKKIPKTEIQKALRIREIYFEKTK
jgi:phage-related protein